MSDTGSRPNWTRVLLGPGEPHPGVGDRGDQRPRGEAEHEWSHPMRTRRSMRRASQSRTAPCRAGRCGGRRSARCARSGSTPRLATPTIATKATMNGGTIVSRDSRHPAPCGRVARRSGHERREQHHARQLDDDRRRERDAAGGGRGRDDLGDVVDARSDPGAELLVVEPERPAERRQRHDRERPASVTSATENATSSSSASMTPFAAAIAETPQIENPVATSSERSSEMPEPAAGPAASRRT